MFLGREEQLFHKSGFSVLFSWSPHASGTAEGWPLPGSALAWGH